MYRCTYAESPLTYGETTKYRYIDLTLSTMIYKWYTNNEDQRASMGNEKEWLARLASYLDDCRGVVCVCGGGGGGSWA
jgi:hypothetical protein